MSVPTGQRGGKSHRQRRIASLPAQAVTTGGRAQRPRLMRRLTALPMMLPMTLPIVLSALWQGAPAAADDIDIFLGDPARAGRRPNVLFIIDTSEAMARPLPGGEQTRLQALQQAFATLLQGLDNVNVGLMRFSNPGGPVLYPISPIDGTALAGREHSAAGAPQQTVRDELLAVVNSLTAAGAAPLQDTLYEAALYYTGAGVDYGAYRGGPNDGGPHAYTRVSAPQALVSGSFALQRPAACPADQAGAPACKDERINGAGGRNPTYRTPLTDPCQTGNHIIVLSSGAADRAHSADKIARFINAACDAGEPANSGRRCLPALLRYLHQSDQSALPGTQRITTHAIGFAPGSSWLATLAAAGGGQYRAAAQAAELAATIGALVGVLRQTDSAFVAPVVTLDHFHQLLHRDEIYFALFRPQATPSWPGNLKKYRLRHSDNTLLDFSTAAGRPALDPATGFFAAGARSAWGAAADGADVSLGGVNARLPLYSARKVYSWHAGAGTTRLSNPANRVSPRLPRALLAADDFTAAQFAAHIEWILGRDVDDADGDGVTAENRHIIADPLHSKPVVVRYGGTASEADNSLFFGSNSGFLHAVDGASGIEQFAFVPPALLARQRELRQPGGTGKHRYGIDGGITAWVNDANADGVIGAAGEFVYLYFGLRRGGRNYYALDVTDRDNPALLWVIEGGRGDFAELGQTWSRPVLATININGHATRVLAFAGGYDPARDDSRQRTADTLGRALYIVAADSGTLLWSGGAGAGHTEQFSAMQYSLPARLTLADPANSGTATLIFVGDTGGQLWRFDIHNGATADALISGGVIADLGVAAGADSVADNRRFYHAPDVALLRHAGALQLAVTVGSGFHAAPLSTGTRDRFYMIRQADVFSAPTTYTRLYESALHDAGNPVAGAGPGTARLQLTGRAGWFFTLPRIGEKVLSSPLIFRDTVTFTSYQPPPVVSTSCTPGRGVSRAYQVALTDASPLYDRDDSASLTASDRSVALQSASIVAEPVLVCAGATCSVLLGAEQLPVPGPAAQRAVKTFWREEQ